MALLVGGVNFGSALLSLPLIDRIGRKPILIIGFILMSICMALTGVCEHYNTTTLAKVAVLSFIVAFEFSAGPVFWVYLP